jgi:phosphoglycerate kinase
MNLKKLSGLNKNDLEGKKVIVRMDFDVPGEDYSRIEASKDTLEFLIANGAKLRLIGHKGRPNGVVNDKYSLKNLISPLEKIIGESVTFSESFESNDDVRKIILYENLRFHKGEEENDEEFAKNISKLGDLYVNESFAVSHRAHASFVGIPKFLPSYAGLRLVAEIEQLDQVRENPKRPFVVLISGIKEDKVEMIKKIKYLADKVLVGGRLPEFIEKSETDIMLMKDEKVIVAKLNPDKEDITMRSIEIFENEIKSAGTILLAGVMGKYEDPGHMLGTTRVFTAIANSSAYKMAGGGDTEAALTTLKLTDKFDWISVGGGAMLAYLTEGQLPGIEPLK